MKKLNVLLFTLGMFLCTSLSAQFEIKINPIGALFNSPDISAEYIVSENIGVQAALGLDYGKLPGSGLFSEIESTKSGYRVRLMGKYYFSPDKDCDKFYVGLYAGPRSRKVTNLIDGDDYGYKSSAFAVGLTGGFKWVGDNGLVFEIGAGAGRAFGQKTTWNDETFEDLNFEGFGLDGFLSISLGYRFGG